ncbi:hypothetical protein KJ660_02320, partial [Candidatus Micrarchaeota archaeon]|nr:hypothetical protein [Candidatus Micrarchaeota archaeon]
ETPENCHDDCMKGECGDNMCGFGEDPNNCPQDCGAVMNYPMKGECPNEESIKKVLDMCKQYGLQPNIKMAPDGCTYAECMASGYQIGPGPMDVQECNKIFDPETGMERVECGPGEGFECRPEPPEIKQRCEEQGGTSKTSKDPRGCTITICEFGGYGQSIEPGFFGTGGCPAPEEMEKFSRKCEESGLNPVIERGFDGCNYIKCGEMGISGVMFDCSKPPLDEVRRMEAECNEKGGRLVESYDSEGCPTPKCASPNEEGRFECIDVPKIASTRCGEAGGELVVKKDDQGCVMFSDCVMRGREEFEFGRIDEIPNPTELLDLAIKLEELKIEFDKLEKRVLAIAEYYESEGSTEDAERMKQASSMFASAEAKIDEIRESVIEISDNQDEGSLIDIKQDIRQLKEVIKDIVYLMLGSKKKTEEAQERGGGDCGTDGGCFERALRMCSKATVTHNDMGQEFFAEIIGLEGGKCHYTIKVAMEGERISMDCFEENYAFSELGPERFEKICKGELLDFMMEKEKMMSTREMEEERTYAPDGSGTERGYEPYEPMPMQAPQKPMEPKIPQEIGGQCREIVDQITGQRYMACPINTKEKIAQANPFTGFVTGFRVWR